MTTDNEAQAYARLRRADQQLTKAIQNGESSGRIHDLRSQVDFERIAWEHEQRAAEQEKK